MKRIIACIQLIIILAIVAKPVMGLSSSEGLPECIFASNCRLVEWSFPKLNQAYESLVDIASSLPRVTIVEKNSNYWHGVVRSLIFRFPDDLEILRIPSKNIIQVRSASRIGLGDLGVNQERIDLLYSKLQETK